MPALKTHTNRTNDIPLGDREDAVRIPAPKPVTTPLDGLAYTGTLRTTEFELPTRPVAKVVQIDSPKQSASIPGCNAEVHQALDQVNLAEVDGHVWLSLEIAGAVRGRLEGVEVGEVTSGIHQSNAATQSVRVLGTETVEVSQLATQANEIDVDGNVGVTLCVDGDFTGKVRALEAGLVTGDLAQRNYLVQKLTFQGTIPAEFEQEATQGNLIAAAGSLDVTFKVGEQFAGLLRDVDLGLLASKLKQNNAVVQNATGRGGDGEQSVLQASGIEVKGDVDLFVKVEEDFAGMFQGLDVGLITGTIIQRNQASQTATLNGKPDAAVEVVQSASQLNLVTAEGTLDARLDICGSSYGRIDGVEIGLITADIEQINLSAQTTSSAGSRTGLNTQQDVLQQNIVEVFADLRVGIVVDGDFTGSINDVEIGLLTGGISQVNDATQVARPSGSALQTQAVAQENLFRLDLIDDVDISIVVDGPFDGELDGLTIGLTFAEVEQGNFSFQKTTGAEAALSARAATPDLSRFATRSHSFDADGRLDLDIDIVIDAGNADDFSDLFIGIEVVDLLPVLKDALWA